MVFLYFLARPDWRKSYGFPDFFPAENRSGLGQSVQAILYVVVVCRLSSDRDRSVQKYFQSPAVCEAGYT